MPINEETNKNVSVTENERSQSRCKSITNFTIITWSQTYWKIVVNKI